MIYKLSELDRKLRALMIGDLNQIKYKGLIPGL